MKPFKVTPRGWNIFWHRAFFRSTLTEVTFEDIASSSLAGQAGFKSGDQILKINGQPVKGMKESEMQRLLWPTEPTIVLLEVLRPGSAEPHLRTLTFPRAAQRKIPVTK